MTGPRASIVAALADEPSADVGFSQTHLPGVLRATKHALTPLQQAEYQCVVVIDGWGFPGNLRWALSSGAVPLIASQQHVGFFHHHFVPQKHYVPLRMDGSDAAEAVRRVVDPRNAHEMQTLLKRLATSVAQHFAPAKLRAGVRKAVCEEGV